MFTWCVPIETFGPTVAPEITHNCQTNSEVHGKWFWPRDPDQLLSQTLSLFACCLKQRRILNSGFQFMLVSLVLLFKGDELIDLVHACGSRNFMTPTIST